MASIEAKVTEFTECSICLKTFTDPRVLPCIHTFCLHCLQQFINTAEKKDGKQIPCPLCRTEFIIPDDGAIGFKKNFFIEQLTDVKKSATMQTNITYKDCDICRLRTKGKGQKIPEATMRCLECEENLCDDCTETHRLQKLTKSHHIVKSGSDSTEETAKLIYAKFCRKQGHEDKTLDYYCTQCKKIVCVSCFVEIHSTHGCKNVNSVGKDFIFSIQEKVNKISNDSGELLRRKESTEQRKSTFLKSLEEKEKLILQRSQELKTLIDNHAKSLLQELSSIKETYVKKMAINIEEIKTCEVIVQSFKEYCNVLTSKGSLGHICDCYDDIMKRADELQKHDEALLGLPDQDVKVHFNARELNEAINLSMEDCIGTIEVQRTRFENFAVVVGINNGSSTTSEVLKINLHCSGDVQHLPHVPTSMEIETAAAVYNNTIYVTGFGSRNDEIWKYNSIAGWDQCGNLVQGRRRHSVAFVDKVLYICGGYADAEKIDLDTVESYCTAGNKCTTVGKLIHACQNSGNCVPYKKFLYIFGGGDKNNLGMNHVQVYNTRTNICVLMSPVPLAKNLMRAALWQDSAILLSDDSCFIYDFQADTWHRRMQFKTDVYHFGLALMNDRVFAIGGGILEQDNDGETKWTCRDDVRYVLVADIIENKSMEWKEHAKLPKPCLVHSSGIMQEYLANI